MVRAWYMDSSEGDQRMPHMTDPPVFVDLQSLQQKTRIEYFKVDADNYKTDKPFQSLRKVRGYNYEDTITISPEKLEQYEEKIKGFFKEHIHSDEEIRFIVDGSGYFDARDREDKWIRVEVEKGDLIILPAGIYHRFTLDTTNYIKANRYFLGEPVWTPIYRPVADDHEARKQYHNSMDIRQ